MDTVHIDIWILAAVQRTIAPVFNMDIGFLVQFADCGGRNFAALQRFSDILDTAHGYSGEIHLNGCSLPRRRYRSTIAVSKEIPFKHGKCRVIFPDVVVRLWS